MSTSGVTTLQLSRDDIIGAALRKLAALAQGQTPTTEDYTNGAQALNTLIAYFRTLGMPLWARKEHVFNPVAGTQSYNIGSGQTLNTPYPIKMLQAYRTDSGSTNRVPIEIVPNYNFNMFPANSGGAPVQLNYQPLNNYGVVKLWPVPDTTATGATITLIYTRPFEYFNNSADTMDLPEEWYLPVIYGLAKLLAPEWSIPLEDRRALSAEAKEYLDTVLSNGTEDGSFYFQVHRIE